MFGSNLLFNQDHHRSHEHQRGFKIITQPTIEPVTLSDVRSQIGITVSSDTASDSLITRRITEARSFAEEYCRRAFAPQTAEMRFDNFPGNAAFELFKPPLIEILSVKYIDTGGTLQTLDPSTYVLDDFEDLATIRATYDTSWPDTRTEKNAVRVQYTCGYDTSALEAAKTISAATNAVNGIFTSVGHGYFNGDIIKLTATGMTEITGNLYRVFVRSTDTFQLANLTNDRGLSTLSYGVFTAGTAQKVRLNIPSLLNEAILLMVGHWMNFQNQSESGVILSRIPYAVRDLLDNFRVYRCT